MLAHYGIECSRKTLTGIAPLFHVFQCQSIDSVKLFWPKVLVGDGISPVRQYDHASLPNLGPLVSCLHLRPEIDAESAEIAAQMTGVGVAGIQFAPPAAAAS